MIHSQVSVIAKHYINKPTDVQFLFNINVLSSLWRIVAGKHLVSEELGNPHYKTGKTYTWKNNLYPYLEMGGGITD